MARKSNYIKSIYSYTKIADFVNCPYRYKLIYIDKIAREDNYFMKRGRDIHKLCEKLAFADSVEAVMDIMKEMPQEEVNKGVSYAEQYMGKKVLGTEIEGVYKLKRGYNLEYHIDVVSLSQDGVLRITDVKTGLLLPTRSELDDDIQLQIYAYIITQLLKDKYKEFMDNIKRIEIGWWLWDRGYGLWKEYITPEWDIEDRLINIIDEIKEAEKKNNFVKKANKYCSQCPVFYECTPQVIKETYGELKELADFYKKKAEKKKKEILAYMEKNGENVIVDNNYVYTIKQVDMTEIDKQDFYNKAIEKGIDIIPYLKPSGADLKQLGIEVNKNKIGTRTELKVKKTI